MLVNNYKKLFPLKIKFVQNLVKLKFWLKFNKNAYQPKMKKHYHGRINDILHCSKFNNIQLRSKFNFKKINFDQNIMKIMKNNFGQKLFVN